MKKTLLFISTVFMMISGINNSPAKAQQQSSTLTPKQQTKVDSVKEKYLEMGFPYELAERRALAVFKSEKKISTRARLAIPPDSSIWVDRDRNSPGNYHPVYHNYTPEELVKKVLLGDPRAESAITNVTFTGHNWNEGAQTWTAHERSLHYFEGGQYLGIEKGLLLATGPALSAEGRNTTSAEMAGGTSVSADPDLNKICSAPTSGSVLEFDFTPYNSRVTFDFIFASEEYGDFSNNHGVNDAFGFFISKAVSPTDTTNIAKFPNDSLVTISNSNWGYRSNESLSYYTANPPDTTGYGAVLAWNPALNGFYVPSGSTIAVNPQWHIPHHTSGSPVMTYDGQTVKLQAVADNLTPGVTYHLKLAICNKTDNDWGSAVFLANLDLGEAGGSVGGLTEEVSIADIDSLGLDTDSLPKYYYGNGSCTYEDLTLDFTNAATGATIVLNYITEDGYTFPESALQNLDGEQLFEKNTFLLAKGGEIWTYDFMVSTNFADFTPGQYFGLTVEVVGSGKTDTVFWKQLYGPLSWNPRYQMPTDATDKGFLNLGIQNGTSHVYRSINGGKTWKHVDAGFSNWELLYIGEHCDILLYQPYYNRYDTIKIRETSAPVTLQRAIDIKVPPAGVVLSHYAGRHYAAMGKNFSFTAKYNEKPLIVQAEGYYSKIVLNLSEGAVIQMDGSYKYTIPRVVEPWTVSFSTSTDSGGETSNSKIGEQTAAWSSGDKLYLKSPESSIARIYTLTGSLYRELEINGDKVVQLPHGFYVVSLNGKRYKVMIK